MNKDRVAMVRQFAGTPSNPKIDEAKRKFEGINEFVTEAGGWMTSIPGDPQMRFEALPGSSIPRMMEARGYIVVPTGTTQRILAHAVAQPMTMSSSGALVAAIENSTRPTTVVITNAGIATVEQYDLRMP
jgi:hypothetical protein